MVADCVCPSVLLHAEASAAMSEVEAPKGCLHLVMLAPHQVLLDMTLRKA